MGEGDEGNPETTPGTYAARQIGDAGRRPGAVALVAVLAALAVLTVSLAVVFAGAVRLGAPAVSGVTMSAGIDRRDKPSDATRRFSTDTERIYCCARVRAFDDTVLAARWSLGDRPIKTVMRTFSRLAGVTRTFVFPVTADVAFYLVKPAGGWTQGVYEVEVTAGGRRSSKASFTVVGGTKEVSGSTTNAYTDPAGEFTVTYPEGWVESPDTESLVEFVAPLGGSYPPRFAVVGTDLTSASQDDLNGNLDSAAAGPGEQFTAYSLGGASGAKRVYRWTYQADDGSSLSLETMQVLVKGKDGVYGVNCHALASDFDQYLPTFDALVNSFRVKV